MVQARRDPLTGAVRDDVLMSRQDAEDLGVKEGGRVLLRSKVGEFNGRCKIVPIKVRNLQVHWPEGSVLLKRGAVDPVCGIPDYNSLVQIEVLEGKEVTNGRKAR